MKKRENTQNSWRVIEFEITYANEIIQIDEKISPEVDFITSASIHCIPNQNPDKDILECGELSLSANNKALFHLNTNYANTLSGDPIDGLKLYHSISHNSRIKGYYRDYGKMKNSSNSFIPYRIKILFNVAPYFVRP